MRHWLIANAKAGNGAKQRGYWQRCLAHAGLHDLEIRCLDDGWEDAIAPSDRVLVAGGDGTVSQAARGCLARGATLGILPSGTANDFARNLDLPADPAALCRLMAAAPARRIDVARVNDALFLNVVHVGLGTLPVTQASPRLKRYLGRFSYLAVLMRQMGLRRGFKAEIHHADGRVTGRWLSIAVASGAYFGGGQRIPEASPHDGKLTVVAVRPRPWWQLMRAFVITRLTGVPPRHDDAVVHLDLTECRLRLSRRHLVTADGETLGRFAALDFHADPASLEVIAGER